MRFKIFRYNDDNGNTIPLELYRINAKTQKDAINKVIKKYKAGNMTEIYEDREPIIILLGTTYYNEDDTISNDVTNNWISRLVEIEQIENV